MRKLGKRDKGNWRVGWQLDCTRVERACNWD